MNNQRTLAFVFSTEGKGWLASPSSAKVWADSFRKAKIYQQVGHAKTALKAYGLVGKAIVVPLTVEFNEKDVFFRVLKGE